jgi:DNA-binding transcriptional LysR family regulator
MITERKIKSFLAVANMRSFTGAGRLLCMSQQAVSMNVLALEKDVGVPLLIRNHHSVSFTTEGELLYAFLEESLHEFDVLVADFRAKAPIGTVTNNRIDHQYLPDGLSGC